MSETKLPYFRTNDEDRKKELSNYTFRKINLNPMSLSKSSGKYNFIK